MNDDAAVASNPWPTVALSSDAAKCKTLAFFIYEVLLQVWLLIWGDSSQTDGATIHLKNRSKKKSQVFREALLISLPALN